MDSASNEIVCANDHLEAAGLIIDRLPLLACEHLLTAIVHGAKAARAGWSGPIDFSSIPSGAYRRTNATAIAKLTSELRGWVREAGRDEDGLVHFGRLALGTATAFINDMEDFRGFHPAPMRAEASVTPMTAH